MDRESKYFTLSMESLRVIAGWAADRAERALPVYERQAASDSRPRAAIEGIREFARGGKRAARLRSLALDAHRAAREIGDPAAAAAARAAGVAAASAYTHPLADVHQTKHVVGAAAYAALALELDDDGDQSVGDAEVRRAIEHAPSEVGEVLLQMPARQPGKSRLDTILHELDAGIRARTRSSAETDGIAGISAAQYEGSQQVAATDDLGSQPFYHGTRADLKPGDLIEPGYRSNYGKRKQATYIYLTATLDAATWGAELSLGEGPGRIYIVEPTGPIMDDPNLTDKKYPGNPTKSYRSREPLRVTGEVTDWQGHSPEALKAMKDNLERLRRLGIEAIDD